jgi:FSR family fosmidomycin resistance protein-like MFS transporter
MSRPPSPKSTEGPATSTAYTEDRMSASGIVEETQKLKPERAVFTILGAISFCHLLNDMMQSLIPAIYPILKESFRLDFGQLGLITLTNQLTASLLQPVVGYYTDRNPKPYSLPVGMTFTLAGLVCLSLASSFPVLLVAVAFVGVGSAVFHPESLFQVGGNAGSSLGPLLAAFIVVPHGQSSIAWFSVAALLGMAVLTNVGNWYKSHIAAKVAAHTRQFTTQPALSTRRIAVSIAILLALIFSKYFYLASLTSYYTFYLIHKFHVSVQSAQIHLFVFLGAVAAGTIIGGPVGDRIGRKYVIWGSILGVLPFTLLLPYANLFWTGILVVPIGLILASAFSAILVYAQELVPGRVGMVSGLFFGFAFGMGGIGAALLGQLADHTDINFVYQVCSYLPLIGLLTGFLPDLDKPKLRLKASND